MGEGHVAVSRVLEAHGVLDPSALMRQTDLAPHEVYAVLLDLEIQGLAELVEGDRYRWTGVEEGTRR